MDNEKIKLIREFAGIHDVDFYELKKLVLGIHNDYVSKVQLKTSEHHFNLSELHEKYKESIYLESDSLFKEDNLENY